MIEYDTVIVGGGPTGGFTAAKIAEKNYKVAIFERNKKTGVPMNCAGLVTPRVFNLLKNIPQDKIIQNKIKGANIHSPSDEILSIGGNQVHALVINRTVFDQEIIKKAKEQKADLYLNNTVLSLQKKQDFVEIKTSKNINVKCKILIGADGPFSKTRDRFILHNPKEFLHGIGAEVSNTCLNPDYVEIFLDNRIAPGFFAWIIPINKEGTKARIGLCTTPSAPYPLKQYFSNFLKDKKTLPFLKNSKIITHIGGVIPLGVLKKTYTSNVMVVGDAAAQVKPTSGGGVYTGLLCANYCSQTAIEALKNNDYSSRFLKKYQKLWSADIGRELNIGWKLRTIFKNLTDKQINEYIKKFQNPEIIETINQYGDIDYPSKLIKPLLKKTPFLLKLLPKIIKE
ncbi:MAG: hypothetical protein DRM99_01055 [Thermoplasmata archaeon]|nr:MAG: hypothetical protein DRM99_01055 [Thermoplasmata archaeon]